jgi:hypothetical protein
MGILKDELIKLGYGGTTEDVVADYKEELREMGFMAKRGRSIKMKRKDWTKKFKIDSGKVLEFHKDEPLSWTIYKLLAHKKAIEVADILKARDSINAPCKIKSVMVYTGHLNSLGITTTEDGVISVTDEASGLTASEIDNRVHARYGTEGSKKNRKYARKAHKKQPGVAVRKFEELPVPTVKKGLNYRLSFGETAPAKDVILNIPISDCFQCASIHRSILDEYSTSTYTRCPRTLLPLAEVGVRPDCPLRTRL